MNRFFAEGGASTGVGTSVIRAQEKNETPR